tara:strand:+ start:334 stop:1599 length:1266 start_codon:yes stop_codon:yes gene_type:complete
MAADVGLIRASKDAWMYQNPSFGKELADPFNEVAERRRLEAEKLRLERKATEERINREITRYIDQFPPGIAISNIPEIYRSAIEDFSFKQKRIYSDAVTARVNMQAGTDEYQEQTNIMNQSLQAMSNLKAQWNLFGQSKEDNLTNFTNKNFSKANDLGNIALNGALFTDKLNVIINDQGDLFFDDGRGGFFKMTDLKLPSLKAADEAMFVESLMVKAFDSGQKLSDATVNLTMSQIKKTIEKGGIDVLKSLAVDDLVAGISLYEGTEEIFNRINSSDEIISLQAKEELENELLAKYRQAIIQQSNLGFNQKNPNTISSKHQNWMKSNEKDLVRFYPIRDFTNIDDEEKTKIQEQNITGQQTLSDRLNEEIYYDGYYVEYVPKQDAFLLSNQAAKEGMRAIRYYKFEELPLLMKYVDLNPID